MIEAQPRDYEGRWWLAQAVHAELRERHATNYCLIAGAAFMVGAMLLLLVLAVPQPNLDAEEAVSGLQLVISLLLALVGLLWWSAFWTHRRLRFDHLAIQAKAYEAGYSVDGRRGCWSKVRPAAIRAIMKEKLHV